MWNLTVLAQMYFYTLVYWDAVCWLMFSICKVTELVWINKPIIKKFEVRIS